MLRSVFVLCLGLSLGCTGGDGTDGAPGVVGAPGVDGQPGAVGLTWRGPWSSDVAYVINDAIFDDETGSSFICVAAVQGPRPDASDAWQMLARGAVGPQGPEGPPGQDSADAPEPSCPEDMLQVSARSCLELNRTQEIPVELAEKFGGLTSTAAQAACIARGRRLCTVGESISYGQCWTSGGAVDYSPGCFDDRDRSDLPHVPERLCEFVTVSGVVASARQSLVKTLYMSFEQGWQDAESWPVIIRDEICSEEDGGMHYRCCLDI